MCQSPSGIDPAAEHPSPKAAFGGHVSGIEDDDLVVDLHRAILARFAGPEHALSRLRSSP
jgi:hypothetical protein